MTSRSIVSFVLSVTATFLLAFGSAGAEPAVPQAPTTALDQLVGRWTGEGRLGFSEGKFENVKCRVTYLRTETAGQLKQNIRCASASGNIEVLSELLQNGAQLTGKWTETVRNMNGELTGEVTPSGFRVEIKGADLQANMDIMARGTRQLVEIQFHGSTLVGLSLMLVKG
jgi:hypothetical protein